MPRRLPLLLLGPATLLALAAFAPAQEAKDPWKADDSPKADAKAKTDEVVTHHEVKLGARTLKYTATAGMLPIKDATGQVEANLFAIAYTLDGVADRSRRPLMFSFNGGPGSASVWLHLGALGPKRVVMPEGPTIPAPPFRLVDNESTWLDLTDLVFIDPVGTGYSRAAKPELTKKFHGVRGDIDSVGEFIRLYLTRNERWGSPLYLVGESYGTTRAAGLAGRLVERSGIAFNGIILVSAILNFQTLTFQKGNDLPYVLYLPAYTATAWYHKKLAPDLQGDLARALKESETWATGGYSEALLKGDRLTDDERKAVVVQFARLTGLDPGFVNRSRLRVSLGAFRKELLRSDERSVGRLDSRYKGVEESAATSAPENDPSMSAIRPTYTATINQYLRQALGYKTDMPYFILGEGVNGWDWDAENAFADTSDALRRALAQNPAMRVLVASGYYDLATPYFATEYTLAHTGIDPSLRSNVQVVYYEAGHMMYAHGPSLRKLKVDVQEFLRRSAGE